MLMYYENPYVKEYDTILVEVCEDNFDVPVGPGTIQSLRCIAMVFDNTIMFPEGGGQPADTGTLRIKTEREPFVDLVVEVFHVFRGDNGNPVHLISETWDFPLMDLPIGTTIHQTINWPRRYRHMSYHTGQHLLSALADNIFGWDTLSWQLSQTGCYVELKTPNISNKQLETLELKANENIVENLSVKSYLFKPGERDQRLETMIKLLHVEKGKKKKEPSTFLHFIVGRDPIIEKFDNMYKTEILLSSTLEKQPEEFFPTIVEMKESQKKAKQKIKILEEENVMLQIELFKEKKPMPEIFSLHRKDGDVDLLNFAARQFSDQLKTGSVTLFLTAGEGEGNLLLVGNKTFVEQVGPVVCNLMSGKGQLRGNTYRARIQMSGRKKALEVFTEAFASFRPAADQ